MAFVTIGGVYGTSSSQFFNSYQDVIGGDNSSLKHSPVYGAGLKFWLSDNYRVSVAVDYFKSEMYDSFAQSDSLKIGKVNRNIAEKLSSSTIPLTFSLDFIPVEQQFKTYVSLGGGIVISKVNWTERVYSDLHSDLREGGALYDKTDVFPLLRGAVGLELNFDKSVTGNIIGSLTLELRYTYMFRNLDLFGKVKNQFDSPPSQLEEDVSFIPGYMSLNLQFGIEFFQKVGK